MQARTKRKIIEKARLSYGLTHILRDCVDDLRIHANSCELDKLDEAVDDTKETLQKLTDIVTELEYILYLYNSR